MDEINTLQTARTDADLLPVVNERDEVIDVRPRREVHLQGLRHRAVHIVVMDSDGNIWLQRRAASKDTFAGFWDLSATGHVDPDETYDLAARRELREELGLQGEPEWVAKVEASARTGWEFHAIYRLMHQGEIEHFNRGEIDQMRLFTPDEICQAIHGAGARWPLTPGVADGVRALKLL